MAMPKDKARQYGSKAGKQSREGNRERRQLQRSISAAATAVSVSLAQQASLADQRSVDILDRSEEKIISQSQALRENQFSLIYY
jgi:hypothetical protein